MGAIEEYLRSEMEARVLAAVDECLGVALKALAAPADRRRLSRDEEIARSDAGVRCCRGGAEGILNP